jgi:hypothetical protein
VLLFVVVLFVVVLLSGCDIQDNTDRQLFLTFRHNKVYGKHIDHPMPPFDRLDRINRNNYLGLFQSLLLEMTANTDFCYK